MAYFHSIHPKTVGGLKQRVMIRVVGETIEQMRRVARLYPEDTVITSFPRSVRDVRTKRVMKLLVDHGRDDILQDLQSTPVSENHIKLITCELRLEWYEKIGRLTEDDRHWLRTQIRGTLHQLLRHGDWVDEPETLGLQKLNKRLEKFDLGRRSDLKFSSQQSEIQKYDPDARRVDLEPTVEEETPDFDAMYRDGDGATRAKLLGERPWMRGPWTEKYGGA